MAQAYVVQNNGETTPMQRVRCKNEDAELQQILEKNPDMLPGDQIRPDDPRRWLLIEREMSVPDPSSGMDRWSIDFFFVDQSAMPTFIECKRYEDSRSRREVIGQMLDYAANGHYYWTKGMIRELAEKNATARGLTLEEALRNLHPDDDLDADEFFQRVEDRLREGQVRLVFFLEESSMELRSIVDFLNRQMERSEVLIVEARQFLHEGIKIVVPTLFGYTEEARQVKRTVTVTSGTRRKWDAASFFEDAQARLDRAGCEALRRLYEASLTFSDHIRWGSGAKGSFNPVIESVCNRAILTVTSDGRLTFNVGWLEGSDTAISFRNDLAELVSNTFHMELPETLKGKYPALKIEDWLPKGDDFIEVLVRLARRYRGGSSPDQGIEDST